MGVFVKDWVIPKTCDYCPMSWYDYTGYVCGISHKKAAHTCRPKHCPLVSVAVPHGDLIDVEKLRDEQNIWLGDGIAPSVIEAERKEKN